MISDGRPISSGYPRGFRRSPDACWHSYGHPEGYPMLIGIPMEFLWMSVGLQIPDFPFRAGG
jgi:hypothetical protein